MGSITEAAMKKGRFVESCEDRHFGHVDIYQKDDRTYISMIKRIFARNGDDRIINDFLKTI